MTCGDKMGIPHAMRQEARQVEMTDDGLVVVGRGRPEPLAQFVAGGGDAAPLLAAWLTKHPEHVDRLRLADHPETPTHCVITDGTEIFEVLDKKALLELIRTEAKCLGAISYCDLAIATKKHGAAAGTGSGVPAADAMAAAPRSKTWIMLLPVAKSIRITVGCTPAAVFSSIRRST